MSPSELIYFLIIGLILLLVLIVIGFILRKRKKWMITLMTLVVLCYVGYYVYFFTSQVNIHAERYEIVTEYLEDRYPDKEFTVLPKHYVEGYTVGQFQVNDIENPNMGVTLNVDKKERVSQTGYWSDHEYPTQQELWRVVQYQYGEPLTLDKETSVIVKIDEWIDGELTAFALKIDWKPSYCNI
ncbi:hypothetical protein [Ornithinibacillus scapharcae]|uniref:hypothetical protein n=1 Tax=Ornithinibacillus scapharcae TaxID=1147159 RepID=UPI000225B0D6|nr:hypothetical protein [Ornithinibacillus scapharcae]